MSWPVCLGYRVDRPDALSLLDIHKEDTIDLDMYQRLHSFSVDYPEDFWLEICDGFTWTGEPQAVIPREFVNEEGDRDLYFMRGTRTNACENMLDRHVKNGLGARKAIHL